MKPCCHETFKRALEEVLFVIKTNNVQSIPDLVGALVYAVKLLEEQNTK